jgi:hypothetical protein
MELKGKYLTSVPPTIAAQLPERYDLSSYPNPFNPTTTIKYEIPAGATGSRATEVKLAVYDLLGREVATLSQGPVEPGVHQVKFDGRELASGTYLCRLTAGSATITRKLLLIR